MFSTMETLNLSIYPKMSYTNFIYLKQYSKMRIEILKKSLDSHLIKEYLGLKMKDNSRARKLYIGIDCCTILRKNQMSDKKTA